MRQLIFIVNYPFFIVNSECAYPASFYIYPLKHKRNNPLRITPEKIVLDGPMSYND